MLRLTWISGSTAWPPNVNATPPSALSTPKVLSALDCCRGGAAPSAPAPPLSAVAVLIPTAMVQ